MPRFVHKVFVLPKQTVYYAIIFILEYLVLFSTGIYDGVVYIV